MTKAEFIWYYNGLHTVEDCERFVARGVGQCVAGCAWGPQNLHYWQTMLERRKKIKEEMQCKSE